MMKHCFRSSISCAEVERQLSAYADDALPPKHQAALRAHLANCGRCAQSLRDLQQQDAELRAEFGLWRPRLSREASARIQDHLYQRMRGGLLWARTMRWVGNLMSLILVVGLMLGGYLLWQQYRRPLTRPPVSVPGSHLWAAEGHDAQGTFWAATPGLRQPQLAWAFNLAPDFSGGPVVAADGALFIASMDGRLHALTPDGDVRWQVKLPAVPVGSPALGASGQIYVADVKGQLSAFTPHGQWLWTAISEGDAALSGPIAGLDETVYYATEKRLIAVTFNGAIRWQTPLPTFSYISPLPRLSPDNQYLFFMDTVLDAGTGELLFGPTSQAFDQYVVGVNGRIYLHDFVTFAEWRPTSKGAELTVALNPAQTPTVRFPFPMLAGVGADGLGWIYLSTNVGNKLGRVSEGELSWSASQTGGLTIGQMLRGRVVALDHDGTIYACDSAFRLDNAPTACRAYPSRAGPPGWGMDLPAEGAHVIGGALVPGALYLVTESGELLAFHEGQP